MRTGSRGLPRLPNADLLKKNYVIINFLYIFIYLFSLHRSLSAAHSSTCTFPNRSRSPFLWLYTNVTKVTNLKLQSPKNKPQKILLPPARHWQWQHRGQSLRGAGISSKRRRWRFLRAPRAAVVTAGTTLPEVEVLQGHV